MHVIGGFIKLIIALSFKLGIRYDNFSSTVILVYSQAMMSLFTGCIHNLCLFIMAAQCCTMYVSGQGDLE